jgi:superfamily II DNA or RNA helicase
MNRRAGGEPSESAFQTHAHLVSLDRRLVEEERLREAQLGACGALLAHATVSDAPAQIVLPTGVGKSLVLTAAPYLLRARRALVVAPGRLVRDQLFNGFKTLKQLTDAGMLPQGTPAPQVRMARRLATPEDWEQWASADVVVGTPQVLSDGYPAVTRVPRDLFDLVIFDEAHHLPAYTWTRLHEAVEARAVLLTATPIRRDGQRLPGEIAFVYPLQRAMDAGVYSPVTYVPVRPAAGADKDRTLAEKAKERLFSEEHRAANSRLLVRADRRADAETLVELYETIGVPLGLIVASSSARTVRAALEKVTTGELLGFACVGSLTEGFDFPTLKIAAYHAPHRSLQPTLQFLGRLSRVTTITGELIADPRDLSRDTARLYRSDDAWSRLLPQIVDSSVAREQDTRRFIDEAAPTGTSLRLPWLSLAPPRSVQIYRVPERPDLDIDLDVLAGQRVIQRLYQPSEQLLALLTQERSRPRFAASAHLDGSAFHLHLAHWVADPGLLFMSTDRPAARTALLARSGVVGAPLIGAADLRRLLAATNATRFFNVGLRESRPREAFNASYETLAGAHADAAVGPDDLENKLLGHAMGRAGSGTGTFGISTAKGKYWEPARAESLFEFREWCAQCASNVRSGGAGTAPTALQGLRIADRISRYPDHPIAATFHESFLAGQWMLQFGGEDVEPVDVDLDVASVDDGQVRLTMVRGGEALGTVAANVDGSFEADPNARAIDLETGEVTPLAVRLQSASPTIYFGDGSVVLGSASSTPNIHEGTDPPEFAIGMPWTGVNLAAEAGDPGQGLVNIQQFARGRAAREATWVITDHGSGELADIIAITAGEAAPITVELLHCKGSREPPGGRVEDLYDVLGQALRSVRHCRPGPSLWAELSERLEHRAATRLLDGDPAALTAALSDWSGGAAPLTAFRVTAVQPGLLMGQAGSRESIRQLLFAVQTHCFAQGVELCLWCNDGS